MRLVIRFGFFMCQLFLKYINDINQLRMGTYGHHILSLTFFYLQSPMLLLL